MGKTYRGVKIPKLNGRPQLWARMGLDHNEGIRIIYPDGSVAWDKGCGSFPISNFEYVEDSGYGTSRMYACTSDSTQLKAIKNSIDWDTEAGEAKGRKPVFLGYL